MTCGDRLCDPLALGFQSDSDGWIARLNGQGPEREAAVKELHGLLLGASRREVARRRAAMPQLRNGDYEDLAQQSADDALVAVLGKLADFRGHSRFTTWAYKFALYEAASKVRRRAWQGREIPLEPESWAVFASGDAAPQRDLEARELLTAIREAIETELSPRQRRILVAVALNDVPIDVMADRLGSTRGALYKTIHDARRKLRAALVDRELQAVGQR
jgi:RNA polymerase sigma-70 factor, ECF subfamily